MKNMSVRIVDAGQMYNIALVDPTLQQELNNAGYSQNRIKDLSKQVERVSELNAVQSKEFAEQVAATSGLEKAIEAADKIYMRIVKLARVVFSNDNEAQKMLDLASRRKASASGWRVQAKDFYNVLLNQSGYIKALSNVGITEDEIRRGFSMLNEIESVKTIQKQETAQAIAATAARDAELEKMDQEFSDFKKVCRVIFEDDKESLNKLGLK